MPPRPTNDSYPGIPGTPIYAGRAAPGGGGGSLLTTLTLVNTSGSEQAANFVAPMFGQPFVQGDVPSGQYPAFELTDGTPCPATIHSITTWPDGSMKWCGVLMRVPTTIAGSGSLTINVKNGGSAPAASSRTTGDLTAADLSTVLTGVTNLTGEWTASLNTAITDADDIVQIGDGPAGRIWRIGGPFKQSGSPHGQLHCWHYVAALQNSSGGLLGLRYLGRFGQVWADVNSPTKTYRDCTAQFKRGATLVRQLQGITTRSGNTPGTLGDTFRIPHWTTCTTAGADARWDFIQGGGSASADCTVRAIPDVEYAQRSLIVPPFDLSLSVDDTADADYYINARANHANWAMGTTGEYDYIGLFPAWAARYWINPNAQNEKQLRVNAMCAFGYESEVRKSSTKQCVVKLGAASYDGFGASEPTWWFNPAGGNYAGITAPTDNQKLWATDEAHRPAPCFPAYVATGEPQYLDHMLGSALAHTLNVGTGYKNYKVARPISGTTFSDNVSGDRDVRIDGNLPAYEGAGFFFKGAGVRRGGWPMRDVMHAAAMCPDVSPDGCDYKSALNYVIDVCFDCFNDAMALQPTQFQDDGLFFMIQKVVGQTESVWQDSYLGMVLCHGSAIYPRANVVEARQYIARRYNALHAVGNIALLSASSTVAWTDTGIAESIGQMQSSMGGAAAPLTFSAASNNVTLGTIPGTYADWSPTNGDGFMFFSTLIPTGSRPYAEIADWKRLYAVNCSGKTFQLSETPGGSPLTVVQDYSITSGTYFAFIQDPVVGFSTGSSGGPQGYISSASSAANYHELLGDSVAAGAAALRAHVAFFNYDYASNPKYKLREFVPE